MRPFELGKPSVNSSIIAMPTVVALRPVSSDARVGEHRAVVWNCDSRTPRSAMRVIAGISTRPPKQSQVAMPVSSHTRYRMLGALAGAVGAANGPQSGSESRISSSILPLNSVAIAGLTLVVDLRDSGCRLHRRAEQSANFVLTNGHAAAIANQGLPAPPASRCAAASGVSARRRNRRWAARQIQRL